MERGDVSRWLDDYVEAWRTYDRDRIAALFAEDVEYRYHPYDEPVTGREAVVESWLGEGEHEAASARDPEGTYEAAYSPLPSTATSPSPRDRAPTSSVRADRWRRSMTTASSCGSMPRGGVASSPSGS
jgi:SnoaL-like domain